MSERAVLFNADLEGVSTKKERVRGREKEREKEGDRESRERERLGTVQHEMPRLYTPYRGRTGN